MGKHRYAESTRRFAHVVHAPAVYVAELSTGVVKVGSTSSARARMMSLANEVRREHSALLVRFHIVEKATVKAAFEAETVLVDRLGCLVSPIPGRREYFHGISFDAACELAGSVVGVPYKRSRVRRATPEDHPARAA